MCWLPSEVSPQLASACRCALPATPGNLRNQLSDSERAEPHAPLALSSPPCSDLVLETVPEDEAYELQFGKVFAEIGSDPNSPSVERDDFAIELAMLDE